MIIFLGFLSKSKFPVETFTTKAIYHCTHPNAHQKKHFIFVFRCNKKSKKKKKKNTQTQTYNPYQENNNQTKNMVSFLHKTFLNTQHMLFFNRQQKLKPHTKTHQTTQKNIQKQTKHLKNRNRCCCFLVNYKTKKKRRKTQCQQGHAPSGAITAGSLKSLLLAGDPRR